MKQAWTYISHPDLGGAQLATLGLADGLKASQWRMEFSFSYQGPLADECIRHGHAVNWVRMPEWCRFQPENLWQKFRWLAAMFFLSARLFISIRRNKPDLIYLVARREVLLCGLASLLLRIPMVYHFHGFGLGDLDVSSKLALRTARLIGAEAVFNSRHTLELARNEGWRKESRIVYNGIHFDPEFDMDRNEARRSFGIEDGMLVIGSASRISPGKNFETLLRAVAELKRGLSRPFLLMIAGAEDLYQEGRLMKELKALAEELKISGQLRWLGHVHEMGRFYRALDLFILPTVYESFGRVFVEAMAAGVPTIGTRVGGVPEIIDDGRTGLLVPVDDPLRAAQAMRDLLDHPEKAAALATSGRQSARSRFSLQTHVEQMLKVFEKVS